jgi:hypothetical protein
MFYQIDPQIYNSILKLQIFIVLTQFSNILYSFIFLSYYLFYFFENSKIGLWQIWLLGWASNHAGLGRTHFGSARPKKERKKIFWVKIDPTILGGDRPHPTFSWAELDSAHIL